MKRPQQKEQSGMSTQYCCGSCWTKEAAGAGHSLLLFCGAQSSQPELCCGLRPWHQPCREISGCQF